MELYPDAKVIYTVRDPEIWVKIMDTVANSLVPAIRTLSVAHNEVLPGLSQ